MHKPLCDFSSMGCLLKWKQKQATRNYDDDFFFSSAEMSKSLIVGREKHFVIKKLGLGLVFHLLMN